MEDLAAGRRSGSLSYKERILAVVLAVLLCLGMLRPVPAKAIVGASAVIAGSSAIISSPVGSFLGGLLLAAIGVSFSQDTYVSPDGKIYSSSLNNVGYALEQFIMGLGGTVSAWWEDTVAGITALGGYAAGQEIAVPAEVLDAARVWVTQEYDFSSGNVVLTQSGIYDTVSGDMLVFTQIPQITDATVTPNGGVTYPNPVLGTLITGPANITISDSLTIKIILSGKSLYCVNKGMSFGEAQGIALCVYKGNLYLTSYYSDNTVCPNFQAHMSFGSIESLVQSAASSIAATPALDTEQTENRLVYVPPLPMAEVGGFTVPAVESLTAADVLTQTGTENPPKEDEETGVLVGDLPIQDVKDNEDSLMSAFTSKFPFSIPWDIMKAVQLLAAPPEAPYWEVDFFAPISHRVGGWEGDTSLVIDMGEYPLVGQVCRWTSTLMFVWALMLGTKRLIWTA